MKEFDDFGISIGDKIREIRKLRGYTMKELADRIVECGGNEVTENVISMWELGKRRIFAEQLFYVAKALECSPGMLFPQPNVGFTELFASVPEEEMEIFDYALNKWDGNTRALIQFMGLYMSLPRELRINIAKTGVLMYEMGRESGKVDSEAPDVQLDYIIEQTELLKKTVKKQEELRKILSR